MKASYRNVVINSANLFVIATILEMTLHEFGHFFASIFVHAQGISIHHNYVSHSDVNLSQSGSIILTAAGPIVSLIIGILFHLISFGQKKRNTFFLFNVYMSLFGYIGFFGYMMIAPFFPDGDTGYVCRALGFPMWLTVLMAIGAAIILYFLVNSLIEYMVEMGSAEIMGERKSRKEFVYAIIFLPLIIGIVVTTLLNLPVPTPLSLIAPLCSPWTIMFGYHNAIVREYPSQKANREFDRLTRFQPALVVFLVLIVIVNRLLVNGIYVK